jgi:hypothetical protein
MGREVSKVETGGDMVRSSESFMETKDVGLD